jgi:hydrogenase maturation protein HypF
VADKTQPRQVRREALIRGVVQGVGFRPFVYRLALDEGLAGSIGNDTDGVTIEIEGPADRVEAFLGRLRSETPPLARIDSVQLRELAPAGTPTEALPGRPEFRILLSEVKGRVSTGIPADAATCPDCLRELLDPADRRYRYPFLNCTNCGPRFTITQRIPYDRPQTSMARFHLCAACQREYDDPGNRRFHAQPNACWECGPRVWLVRVEEKFDSVKCTGFSPYINSTKSVRALQAAEKPDLEGGGGFNPCIKPAESKRALAPERNFPPVSPESQSFSAACLAPEGDFSGYSPTISPFSADCKAAAFHARPDPIEQTIGLLLAGQIMAIKGIGGFHLSVDATDEAAVMRLRERKRRWGKPLAVMVRDLDAARAVCELTAAEEALLTTPARPIVLARKRHGSRIAPAVAPGIPWLGVFLPYAPLQHLLFADSRVRALVMTSANLSEEPIAIDNDEAQTRLGGRLARIADAFLMHDREILQRCDDSVAAVVDGAPQLIRRARGFVPLGVELPLKLQRETPPLLAVGGHLKNCFALARGSMVYQSQHLGDLENLTGLEFFRESLDHLMRTFEIEPEFVVHDLHPGYLSTAWATEWARQRGLGLIAVQHHHAHIAGCMAEHGLEGEVIGLALDGAGYGTDGKIWGGEVLICRRDGFERFAHLDSVPMPGGEAAIREPWRMALAHLRAADLEGVPGLVTDLVGATQQEERLLTRMIERGVNAPLTSSLGRLFDAAAAVVLGRRVVDYEAQAAIELEGLAIDEPDEPDDKPGYELELAGGNWAAREPVRICPAPLWRALVRDLQSGVGKPQIAARFHAGVAAGFVQAAVRARAATGAARVALSGGCMHNRRLARLLRMSLQAEGFQVFQHRAVSPGDGGLSYGQAALAAAILAKRG